MCIDAILGWQDFIGGLRPRVANKHISKTSQTLESQFFQQALRVCKRNKASG